MDISHESQPFPLPGKPLIITQTWNCCNISCATKNDDSKSNCENCGQTRCNLCSTDGTLGLKRRLDEEFYAVDHVEAPYGDDIWSCCQCGGNNAGAISDFCPACAHVRCAYCTIVVEGDVLRHHGRPSQPCNT